MDQHPGDTARREATRFMMFPLSSQRAGITPKVTPSTIGVNSRVERSRAKRAYLRLSTTDQPRIRDGVW
jgi:hypothetical protein